MTPTEVGLGVVVRLTAEARQRRLWKDHSDSTATVQPDDPRSREVTLIDNGGKPCVRLNVDADRKSRIRTMQLDYLEVVPFSPESTEPTP